MTNDSLVGKLRSLIATDKPRNSLSARGLERLRGQLRECADGIGGDVSARTRAAKLAETYLGLDDGGRLQFLKLIALEFGPDPARVAAAHAEYQAAVGTPGQ